jgi:hypothetical protein
MSPPAGGRRTVPVPPLWPHPGQLGPLDGERLADPQSRGDQEEDKVGKITLDRLLIGTQPLVKASELVRGQRNRRPLCLGRDLGDVTARVVTRASYPQARAHAPERTLRVALASDRPLPGAEGDGLPVERRRRRAAGKRLAKWLRLFEATSWPGLRRAKIRSEKTVGEVILKCETPVTLPRLDSNQQPFG